MEAAALGGETESDPTRETPLKRTLICHLLIQCNKHDDHAEKNTIASVT